MVKSLDCALKELMSEIVPKKDVIKKNKQF